MLFCHSFSSDLKKEWHEKLSLIERNYFCDILSKVNVVKFGYTCAELYA